MIHAARSSGAAGRLLPGYRDALGNDHVIGDDTKRAFLRAMKIAVDSAGGIDDGLRRLDEDPGCAWPLPCMCVARGAGPRCTLPVTLSETQGQSWLAWRLDNEEGEMPQGPGASRRTAARRRPRPRRHVDGAAQSRIALRASRRVVTG